MEEKIVITMEEYKELLMTKGRYEELKSQQLSKTIVETKPNWSNLRGPDVLLCDNVAKKEPEFNF